MWKLQRIFETDVPCLLTANIQKEKNMSTLLTDQHREPFRPASNMCCVDDAKIGRSIEKIRINKEKVQNVREDGMFQTHTNRWG